MNFFCFKSKLISFFFGMMVSQVTTQTPAEVSVLCVNWKRILSLDYIRLQMSLDIFSNTVYSTRVQYMGRYSLSLTSPSNAASVRYLHKMAIQVKLKLY